MRLIDADAVIIKIFDEFDYVECLEERGAILAERIRRLINIAPTVDAVPVVRCKDCRFSDWYTAVDGKRYCYCMKHGSSGHGDNDFCSCGERDGEQA